MCEICGSTHHRLSRRGLIVGAGAALAASAFRSAVRERAELPGHLPELIKLIEPAVIAAHERHPSDLVAAAIEENVKLNVKRMYGTRRFCRKHSPPRQSAPLAASTILQPGRST